MAVASFNARVVRGGAWIFGLQASAQVVSFIRVVVLATVLTPADFGIFGYALLVLNALDTFTKTGFREAMIQKKEYDARHLNVVWSVEIVRSLVIVLLMQVASPLVGHFFNASGAEGLVRVIGWTFVIQSFSNIGMLALEKSLTFKNVFLVEFSGTVADLIATLTCAVCTRSPWAMVVGLLTGNLVRCGGSYYVNQFRPKFSLDKEIVLELFPYSKWIFKTSILGFFIGQSDSLVVGKLLGAASLGAYQLANTISSFPMTQFAIVISKISFPAFSEIQDDREKLCRVYLKMMKVLSLALLPVVVGIIVFIPDFVRLFLNPKWHDVAGLVQIMIFGGLMRPISSVQDTILLAMGRPSSSAKIQLYRVLSLVALVYPLAVLRRGEGVALAVVLSILVATVGFSWKTLHLLPLPASHCFKALAAFSAAFAALTVTAAGIRSAFAAIPSAVGFGLSVLLFLLVYLALLALALRRDRNLVTAFAHAMGR